MLVENGLISGYSTTVSYKPLLIKILKNISLLCHSLPSVILSSKCPKSFWNIPLFHSCSWKPINTVEYIHVSCWLIFSVGSQNCYYYSGFPIHTVCNDTECSEYLWAAVKKYHRPSLPLSSLCGLVVWRLSSNQEVLGSIPTRVRLWYSFTVAQICTEHSVFI